MIIITTPVYALRASGQIKAFLDHFAFQFMVHRPNPKMFSKSALIISTGKGHGMNKAMQDISTSLEYWGISKIYKFGKALYATNLKEVSEKRKLKIEREINSLSKKIYKEVPFVKPNIRTKIKFNIYRIADSKGLGGSQYDREYWNQQGWYKKQRPWN